MKRITPDIYYIGYNDNKIDLFESQLPLSHGMAYNSYLILDEKIAIIDSVELPGKDVWFSSIKEILGNREPDYLVIEHMEPDHSGSILEFIKKYPSAKIITNQLSLMLLNQFFDYDFSDRVIVIKEKDKISLGKHSLEFYFAPMIHWPEVLMVYEEYSKTFFSADAFGKFGVIDTEDNWIDEARRYYFGIVAKYGIQVQNLLKKIQHLQIDRICSLHGPILDKDLGKYIALYDKWSKYESENTDGVFIAYTSVYGNTEKAVKLLEEELRAQGVKDVLSRDLSLTQIHENIAHAFRYKKIVLATTTYNTGIFPTMHYFLHGLIERNWQNKTIGIIENGSWVPQAEKEMKNFLSPCKNLKFVEKSVHIKSGIKDNNIDEIKALAEILRKEE
ncbi:MAG: flavodoxin domain-containing protein [Bacilli bacterium]